MPVNLILAALWLAMGAAMILWQQSNPQAPYGSIPGWACILLAGYNLVRAWSVARASRKRAARETEYLRQQREYARRPAREPDPHLDFTGQPPDPTTGGRGEQE